MYDGLGSLVYSEHMRTVMWGVVIVSTALGASLAHADAPAWCRTDGIDKSRLDGDVKQALDPGDAMRATRAIVKATCFPDDEAKQRAKEVAKAKEAWSKKMDLGDAEWAELAVWGSGEPSSYQDLGDLTNDYGKKYTWSTLDPVEQFAGIQNGFPNNGDGNGASWYTYLADALGPKLTETGRLAYVLQACIAGKRPEVEWAMCQPDITRLDRKKIMTELRSSKASAAYKTKIRFIVYGLDDKLAAHAKEVNELMAKDPAYTKMFVIAETTRKEWDDVWSKQAALVDLALQMDDGRQTASRKAFDGCEDKVWPAWEAEVSKIPAKRFQGFSTKIEDSWTEPGMGVVLSTPGGYLASTALFTCSTKGDKNPSITDAIINTLGEVLGNYPGNRGPRTATSLAIRNAGLQLDDQSESIDYPSADFRGKFHGQSARGSYGTIAKVQAGGKAKAKKTDGAKAEEMVTVTFNKKFEKQSQCAKSRNTNRISYIRSDGGVSYEIDCLKWETVSVDRTPDPAVVKARSAKGLKAGMNAYVGQEEVIAAWPKGAKAPSIVAGAAVK